jgi:hypothetical protein
LLQALPSLVQLIARAMTTGSVDLALQCVEVLSFKFATSSPRKPVHTAGVNRSALANLVHDRLLFETTCVPRLQSMKESHWSDSVKGAADRALSGIRTQSPVNTPMYPPLPISPERP